MVLIESKRAAITSSKIFINASHNFYISQEQVQTLGDKEFLSASYRRFFRMKQFVSKRQMVKDSYATYLRYKFKIEDYELKRKKVLPDCHSSATDFRTAVRNSLQFMIRAFSFGDEYTAEMVTDSYKCKKILKNLLTVDYHRNRLINRSSKMYAYYRRDFKFLSDDRNYGLRQYEENLMRLNESLGTRL
ncbi:unnamed protein product [Kluyveromyces dobzhanskii CBS 2104]|uniref:WGS project CCBQ000000000 data, contig 00223 n=1 Tax=Kluyveromyces dobzhanskii CBS 2104 TaxID=1427455 RepID=A0A0A8L7B4_9SACH|nr:unnamed protein product [Kluyveromyces dobzhanskii CBS 2104]